jgi:hypothetical protein
LAPTAAVNLLQSDASRTLDALRATLADATRRSHLARERNQQQTVELLDTLSRLVESYNVTGIQRETVSDLIEDGIESTLRLHDEASLAEGDFDRVIAMLEKLASNKT